MFRSNMSVKVGRAELFDRRAAWEGTRVSLELELALQVASGWTHTPTSVPAPLLYVTTFSYSSMQSTGGLYDNVKQGVQGRSYIH